MLYLKQENNFFLNFMYELYGIYDNSDISRLNQDMN